MTRTSSTNWICKEFGKRNVCNGSGVIGGTGGAWARAAIGSCICPGIGTDVGGFIGGLAGGMGASAGVGRLICQPQTSKARHKDPALNQ